MTKPAVCEMIKEAVEYYGGRASYKQIKEYIKNNYGKINEGTINCQIAALSVNMPSRIHYPENKKERICDPSNKYDILYNLGNGLVEFYDPNKHGRWAIKKDEYGKLKVVQIFEDEPEEISEEENWHFPVEAHLRDFIVENLSSIQIDGKNLELYVDENSRDGKEYITKVGRIDILAIDSDKNFVVIEIKQGIAKDDALGQLLKYMGWVKKNLAKDKEVKGVIIAYDIDEKLKYAATMVDKDISLFKYSIKFELNKIENKE